MSFETREEVLEKVIAMPRPKCPHCGVEMSLWEEPPMHMGDGLGWGTPFSLSASTTSANYTSPVGNISRNPTPTGLPIAA